MKKILLSLFFAGFTLGTAAQNSLCFTAPVSVSNFDPEFVTSVDVNGDGLPDLIQTDDIYMRMTVIMNTGAGTFTASPTIYPLYGGYSSYPDVVVPADFNGDNKVDLAVSFSGMGNVQIYTNTGTGTFTLSTSLPSTNYANGMTAGDFDGNGTQDLAVGTNTLSVFFNSGGATFGAATPYPAVTNGKILTRDFNGDGKPDLASTNGSFVDSVTVLLNNGSGLFTIKNYYIGSSQIYALTSGDFNGDGKPDLATSNNNANSASILINSGTGTFPTAATYSLSSYPGGVTCADYNLDGKTDVAVGGNNSVSVLLNTGGGVMAFANSYTIQASSQMVSSDLDTNGFPDIITPQINILFNVSAKVNVSGPASICPGSTATLTASGASTYTWVAGPNTATYTVNPTANSTYSVIGTNNDGCVSDTALVSIAINSLPVISSQSGSVYVCGDSINKSFTVTSPGSNTYQWYWNGSGAGTTNGNADGGTYGETNYNTDSMTIFVTQQNWGPSGTQGVYCVVTNTNNCTTKTAFDTIYFNPLPTVTVNNPIILAGSTATLTASGANTYTWSTSATTVSITVTPTVTANYTVTGTDGNGCMASATSTVTVESPGAALNFDGIDDNVMSPSVSSLPISNAYTFESWINISSYQYGTLAAKWDDDGDNRAWMVNMGELGDNTEVCVVQSTPLWGNDIQWASGFHPALNTWYHLAVTFNATLPSNNISLYVNGVLYSQATFTTSLTPSTANLYIGGYDDSGNGLNGGANGRFLNASLDEVRVWNYAKTACQINASMNCEIAPSATAGLVAYYKFNEGIAPANNPTVTTAADSSGNHNNGTLIDFTLTGTTSNWIAPGGVTSGVTCGPTLSVNSATITTGTITGATYQWVNCNTGKSAIAGATNQSYAATASGSYAVVVVVTANGCSDTSACVSVTVTGIEQFADNANVTIYPNPNNGNFVVTTTEHAKAIVVTDILGNEILSVIPANNTTAINLNTQANGIYFVKIITDNMQTVKRIIINN